MSGRKPKNEPTKQGALARRASARDDVPVLVDAVKKLNRPLTRCTYFTIESTELSAGWQLALKELAQVPIFVVDLTGIVCRPGPGAAGFRSADQIEDLFETIESTEKLLVVPSDIMLPTFLLRSGRKPPARGDVFRVGPELMRLALDFRHERMGHARFERECRRLRETVTPSPKEAAAFRAWTELQIQAARARCEQQRSEKRGLRWNEERE